MQTINVKIFNGGINETLEAMKQFIVRDAHNLDVRQFAAALVADLDGMAFDAIAQRMYNYLLRAIKYTRDPASTELVQDLQNSLRLKIGDCDDQTVALGTLLNVLGIPVRFKVASYAPNADYSHVYLEYQNERGKWIAADLTAAKGVGFEMPFFKAFTKDVIAQNGVGYVDETIAVVTELGDDIIDALSFGMSDEQIKSKYKMMWALEKLGVTFPENKHSINGLKKQLRKAQLAFKIDALAVELGMPQVKVPRSNGSHDFNFIHDNISESSLKDLLETLIAEKQKRLTAPQATHAPSVETNTIQHAAPALAPSVAVESDNTLAIIAAVAAVGGLIYLGVKK